MRYRIEFLNMETKEHHTAHERRFITVEAGSADEAVATFNAMQVDRHANNKFMSVAIDPEAATEETKIDDKHEIASCKKGKK